MHDAKAYWVLEPGRGEIRPAALPEPGPEDEGLEKQRQLEERYFSPDALAKYRGT